MSRATPSYDKKINYFFKIELGLTFKTVSDPTIIPLSLNRIIYIEEVPNEF